MSIWFSFDTQNFLEVLMCFDRPMKVVAIGRQVMIYDITVQQQARLDEANIVYTKV